MVLNKQILQLPFQGVQTKLDPKVAPLGSYSKIDNMIMNRYPELVKRDGLSFIGTTTTPSDINASYNFLNEVGVITNNALYSYSPSIDQFQLKGLTASPTVSAKPIIANTQAQTVCDGWNAANDILGVAWEDTRGGIWCSTKDTVSDSFLLSDFQISATGVKPKVVAIFNYIYFFWIEPSTTELKFQQYITTGNNFLPAVSVTTTLASCFTYDVIPAAGNLLIVPVQTGGAPNAVFSYWWNVFKQAFGTNIDGLSSPKSLGFLHSGSLPPAISLARDPNEIYFTCTVYNDSHEIWTKSFLMFTLPLGSETLVGTTADPGWAVSSCVDTLNNTYIFCSSFSTGHNSFQALVSDNVTTPTVVYNQPFFLQMGIATRAFFYSGNAYVVLGYTSGSGLQNSYFGVRDDGACFARFFSTLGGGNIAKANCVSSFSLYFGQPNTYITPLLKTTQIVSSANTVYTSTSVYTEQVFFTPASIDNKVLGKYLNIAGGFLKQYDGSPTVFEQGFHLYPETPVAVASASTGTIANGTYSYIVCWEWTDNQGQLHRSNTSLPVEVTLTGGQNTVSITVPALPITSKETRFGNKRTPVIMAVYRTQTLGTTYYRVNQFRTEFVYNDPLSPTLTYIDTFPDATIQSNSLLYTTGGVFENITLPSSNLMCVAKNRVIVAGTDTEPNQVYVSKQKEEGLAIEFANELSIIVDSLGGDITAVAAMDDKILIFKKSLLFYVAGEGPDPTGNNGSFTIPLLVSADCGCIYPQSIVLCGLGIMFLSEKGIYLCDRQLNVTYIGNPLDAITTKQPGFAITSAVNLPDQNQIYFTTNGDQVLVYDTFFQLWYTQTLPFNPISSTILNNVWYTTSTSAAYMSVAGQPFDGNNKSIQSTIMTNWISVGQLEGFSRIYAIMIAGDNASLAHRLVVNLYYDFSTNPSETLSIVPTSLLGDMFGAGTTFGSDTPYGGTYYDGTYQFVIRPQQQKCSSIRIEIFDQYPDGSVTESFKFSGISIVAGIKQGWNKNLPYTRRLTS